jgi:hypothetical protein
LFEISPIRLHPSARDWMERLKSALFFFFFETFFSSEKDKKKGLGFRNLSSVAPLDHFFVVEGEVQVLLE